MKVKILVPELTIGDKSYTAGDTADLPKNVHLGRLIDKSFVTPVNAPKDEPAKPASKTTRKPRRASSKPPASNKTATKAPAAPEANTDKE